VKVTLPPGATGAELTNLMESEQGGPVAVSSNEATVNIKPWEILTLKVNYPEKQAQQH